MTPFLLNAGQDITVTSAKNSHETSSSSNSVSASAGIGATISATGGMAAGVQVSGAASGSDADSRSDSNTNAEVVAGESLTVTSGQDTTVAGANLEGNTVKMDVGGDLVVASKQDTGKSKNSNWSAGGTATVGMGASVGLDAGSTTGDSASIGMGKGSSSKAWVNKQTSIIGKEQVDIRVEDNTHVEGAVIAAENGNLKLDTDTLTYKDIHDHDKSKNYQANLSISIGGNKKDDDQDSGENNSLNVTTEGSYGSHDRRQINRATIGEGEIIIRSDPDAGLEGLNRDLAKAQEITKDSKTSVTVYIDSSAIDEIMSGGEGIKNNFKTIAEKIKELLPEDADRMREVLQSQKDFYDQLLAAGKTPEEANLLLSENSVVAVWKVKLDKYLTETGELNLTEEKAEKLWNELQDDPTILLQIASNWDYDLQTERAGAQRQFFAIVGAVKAAGGSVIGALEFLNDFAGEVFYNTSGGTLFKAEHESFHKTVNEVATSIEKLATGPVESLAAVAQTYKARYAQYEQLVQEGKHDEAGLVIGALTYDVGETLVGAGAAGAGVLKGTTKLVKLVRRPGNLSRLSMAATAEISAIPKGSRPDPTEYLSQVDIDNHLKMFEGGAVRITSKTNFEKNGTIGPNDGTFVMPKSVFDDVVRQANGNVTAIANKLGLPDGTLGGNDVVVVEIPSPKGLRMASGNEQGANEFWKPGGYTTGDIPEAVIDVPDSGEFIIKENVFKE